MYGDGTLPCAAVMGHGRTLIKHHIPDLVCSLWLRAEPEPQVENAVRIVSLHLERPCSWV